MNGVDVMISFSEFLDIPKIDAHNHLNLGMRYSSYAPWAGFYIPNFPRKMSGLDEMHEIIGDYTRPRVQSAKDVSTLFSLSIEDAIEDGIKILEASVDMGLAQFFRNTTAFCNMLESLKSQYINDISFRPEVGMGKTFDKAKLKKLVPECIQSGVFGSIDLYGPEVLDGIEEFQAYFELAYKKGLKKKAHIGEFSNAQTVKDFVNFFELDEVQHGINAAYDDSALLLLKEKNVRLNITPTSNVMLSAVMSLESHPIKRFVQEGIRVSIATDDLLFFNRSVSEQCADMVNAGLFTKEEVLDILNQSYEESL